MKTAIVPGSFDPMTLGHLNVIKRAAALFDRVIVAVMINDSKEYMFSMEERLEIARLTCSELEGVRVISDTGMLATLAISQGACAIVKGVRNKDDCEYELQMARYNSSLAPNVQTLLLPCEGELEGISSTEARKRILSSGSLEGILCNKAIEYIKKLR